MFIILVVLALLWFAFLAPLHVTIAVTTITFVVAAIVRYSAQLIAGTQPSFGEAISAVALSLLFASIGLLTVFSLLSGSPSIPSFTTLLAAPIASLAPFLGYIVGFRLALGVTLPAAAGIALVSTGSSLGLLMAVRPLLHA